MFRIMDAKDAIDVIKDGDCVGINSFLAMCNPDALHRAITEKFESTGHPNNLFIFCPTGFGIWDEHKLGDRMVNAGAVSKVIAGHMSTMLAVMRLAKEEKIEAYNMPLGVLTHVLRAAAGGHKGYLSKVGLNLFVDPRVSGPGMNSISKERWVEVVEVMGEEYLWYKTPKIDVALIRGTSVDPNGNISFENEFLRVDALAMAQATKANGGTVIVQVEKTSQVFNRPSSVVIPGVLVDIVVVCEQVEGRIDERFVPILSGEVHVPPTQLDYWINQMSAGMVKKPTPTEHYIIGDRAAQELKPGQVVNLGIGIPEVVGKCATALGKMDNITLTVESGCIGGLPAPGTAFGATLGADFICNASQQFDYYDGGGMDICFMGGLEVDQFGNVNVHETEDKFVGIGGFANLTQNTKNVVFCMTFMAKGLKTERDTAGNVTIVQEGAIKKFRKEIRGISFSAKNAIETGQNVMYITERCVFRLTKAGLTLVEVMPGIDKQTQVLDLLDFDVIDEVAE